MTPGILPLERFAITELAQEACRARNISIENIMRRHITRDWGDMPDDDKAQNDRMTECQGFLQSSYRIDGVTLWVITDPGWETTTILLPDEY